MGTLEWEHSGGNMGTQFFLANLSSLKFEKIFASSPAAVDFIGNVHLRISLVVKRSSPLRRDKSPKNLPVTVFLESTV